MDKKTLSGLVIIGLILLGFSLYTGRQQKELRRQQAISDSIRMAQNPAPTITDSTFNASTANLSPQQEASPAVTADSVMVGHLGSSLFAATKGEQQLYTLENNRIKVILSNHGGLVAEVELKDYKSYDGNPLMLFERKTSKFDSKFFLRNQYGDTQINTSGYYFTTDAPAHVSVSEDSQSVSMRLYVDSTAYIEYLYTLAPDAYIVDFKINMVGMTDRLSNQSEMLLEWENAGNQNEKGYDNENRYTDLAYMYPGTEDMEKLGMSKSSESESVKHKIKWVAFKQQFFSSILVANDAFEGAEFKYDSYPAGSGQMKRYNARISVPFNSQTTEYGFQFYFGPNKYSLLKKYDLGFQKLVPLGWGIFGWINRWLVIPVFDFLSKYIGSFGLIILLLTIFIKIIISPMTYKSYLSTAKMRLLKPEIDDIAAKYPDQKDMAKKQQSNMELYKRAGVSPMGGCLPMLIQFPFLIAMFNFFPAAIELRGESFLWADDLSSFDSIFNLPFNIPFYGDHVSMFALLMAGSMYFVTKISSAQTMAAGPQMAGMKFMSLYLMPVMMLMWFNNYSSALSYYYLLSNVITIGQTYAFRYMVDDNKLHAKMKENAKKPRKKSKWTERYDNMLKEQQKQQRARSTSNKK